MLLNTRPTTTRPTTTRRALTALLFGLVYCLGAAMPVVAASPQELLEASFQKLGEKDFDDGRRLAGDALELARTAGDRHGEATALFLLSLMEAEDSPDKARQLLAESRVIFRELEDHVSVWLSLVGEAELFRLLKRPEDALSTLQKSFNTLDELARPETPLSLAGFRVFASSQGLPPEQLTALEPMLSFAKPMLVDVFRAMTWRFKAASERQLGRPEAALGSLEKALELSSAFSDLQQPIQQEIAELKKAIDAEGGTGEPDRRSRLDDPAFLETLLTTLGIVPDDVYEPRALENPEKSLAPLEAALAASRKLQDPRPRAQVLHLLATTYRLLGRLDEAAAASTKSLEIARRLADTALETASRRHLGTIHLLHHRHDDALVDFHAALELSRNVPDPRHELRVLLILARAHFHRNAYEEALARLDEALPRLGDGELRLTAKLLRARCLLFAGDFPAAARAFSLALENARTEDIPGATFQAMLGRNVVAMLQGDVATARTDLWQTLAVAREHGVRESRAVTRLALGTAVLLVGAEEEARAHFDRALGSLDRVGIRSFEDLKTSGPELFHFFEDQLAPARRAFERAGEAFPNPPAEAGALSGSGDDSLRTELQRLDVRISELREHLELLRHAPEEVAPEYLEKVARKLRQSRTRYRRLLIELRGLRSISVLPGGQSAEINRLEHLARKENSEKRFKSAVNHLRRALEIAREIGAPAREARLRLLLGETYIALNLLEDAHAQLETVHDFAKAHGDRVLTGRALLNLGNLLSKLGQHEEAARLMQEAHVLLEGSLDSPRLSAISMLADLEAERSDPSNSNRPGNFKVPEELLPSKAPRVSAEDQEMFHLLQAVESLINDDNQGAEKKFELARSISEKSGNDDLQINSLLGVATAKYLERHEDEGVQLLEEAVGRLEKRSEIRLPLTTQSTSALQGLQGALAHFHAMRGNVEKSFTYAEKTRAISFLNHIGGRKIDHPSLPENLAEREILLRERRREVRKAIQKLANRDTSPQPSDKSSGLMQQWRTLNQEYEELLVEIRERAPEYASLVSVDVVDLDFVQRRLLPPKTSLVAYYVPETTPLEVSFWVRAWVVDHHQARVISLPIEIGELQGLTQRLNDSIRSRDFDRNTAGVLYYRLIAPLRAHLPNKEVIIVPHGVLHTLPFGALWNAAEQRFFIEEMTISLAPSASALRFLAAKRSPQNGRGLVLGDPDGSLPFARAESRTVAELLHTTPLLGEKARERALLDRAGDVDILHLAAHAVYDPQSPLFSRIELADGDGEDGALEVHEIYDLDLAETNLVVLSACESGRGEISGGDKVLGLTRAFFYAGSPSVITSLWRVDDEATAILMERFYRHLQQSPTIAEALRRAQLEMLAEDRWREPYFWASFYLHGDSHGWTQPSP